MRTIHEFNTAVREDAAETLSPPRCAHHRTLDEPPFYLVEVQPGITMTVGGVAVTSEMEVIRRSSSPSEFDVYDDRVDTIEGLYAAGADVGNVQSRHYAGGLAIALVTGMAAGDAAV